MSDRGGEREIAELEEELCTLAAHLNAATSRFLVLVGEFDRREAWASSGAKSCAHWLSWRCCLSPGAAREHVRVARRLPDLPLTAAAFARGELSFSQARAITRIEDVAREAELLELAQDATASQLEVLVRAFRGVVDGQAASAHRRRHLTVTYDDDGSAVLRGRLPAEDAALLVRALEAAQDELRTGARAAERAGDVPAGTPTGDPVEAEPDDPRGAARIDALTRLCDAFLAAPASGASEAGSGSRTGGDRHQVVVHVDLDAIAGRDDARRELDRGPALAPGVLDRLCCDASLVTLVERAGEPLSVGRKTRVIPPSVQRALRVRDGGCRFPGCGQTRHVDAHHVTHWAHGGETSLDNLVQLCRHHHGLVHEGGFLLARGDDGELAFRAPSGRPLSARPRARRGDPGCLATDHARRGLGIDAATGVTRSTGTPLHLVDAVEALLTLAPPPGSEWHPDRRDDRATRPLDPGSP